jgi:hypothetical protein
LAFLASTIILTALAACAPIQNSAEELTLQQSAAVKETCTKVMRLDKGEAHWYGCVSSLSNSLAEQFRADRRVVALNECAQAGLNQDTPDFSRCVLDRERARMAFDMPQAGAADQIDAALIKPADDSSKDYLQATFALRHSREQHSCAALGLMPNSGSFAQCVADLDGNLFCIDHPLT